MPATVHRITKVKAAGKYCEIWLDPAYRDNNLDWDVAPKWYELNKVVEDAGLDDHVLNHGYVGLRLVVDEAPHGYKLVAISTSKPEPKEDGS